MIIEQYIKGRWEAKCTVDSIPFNTEFVTWGNNALDAMSKCFDKMSGLQKNSSYRDLRSIEAFHFRRGETFANMDDEEINSSVDLF